MIPLWFVFWMILAFAWLFYESNWLRIRLPVGKAQPIHPYFSYQYRRPKVLQEQPKDMPYPQMTTEQKEEHLILCQNCNDKCPLRKDGRWLAWKLPARTIKAWDSTINLAEGCNVQRASLLKDIAKGLNRKPRASIYSSPLPGFIEKCSVGSHIDHIKGQRGYRGGRGYSVIVSDYETIYHDCLPGKKWLKAHEHDHDDYQPEIQISYDGIPINHNGNLKEAIKAIRKEHPETYVKYGKTKVFVNSE